MLFIRMIKALNIYVEWTGLGLFITGFLWRVATPAVYPSFVEPFHFDITITEQKSQCININLGLCNVLFKLKIPVPFICCSFGLQHAVWIIRSHKFSIATQCRKMTKKSQQSQTLARTDKIHTQRQKPLIRGTKSKPLKKFTVLICRPSWKDYWHQLPVEFVAVHSQQVDVVFGLLIANIKGSLVQHVLACFYSSRCCRSTGARGGFLARASEAVTTACILGKGRCLRGSSAGFEGMDSPIILLRWKEDGEADAEGIQALQRPATETLRTVAWGRLQYDCLPLKGRLAPTQPLECQLYTSRGLGRSKFNMFHKGKGLKLQMPTLEIATNRVFEMFGRALWQLAQPSDTLRQF